MRSRKLPPTKLPFNPSPKPARKITGCQAVRQAAVFEYLEARQLLSLTVGASISPVLAHPTNAATDSIDLTTHFSDPTITGTVVEFTTSEGVMDVALTDNATPLTVANFLNYVNGGYDSTGTYSTGNGTGAYDGTFFHRSVVLDTNAGPVPPALSDIVQGGGYVLSNGPTHINTGSPVANEVTTETQGNIRGSIAMAKTSDPNSATSEFYFNVHGNSALDDPTNSGGFTTFGNIIGSGLTTLDALAGLPTYNLDGGTFSTLPVVGLTEAQVIDPTTQVQANNLTYLNKIKVVPGITYTVTSSRPDLVTPTISGNALSFAYTAGAIGVAEISLTATSLAGGTNTQTFPITVPDVTQPAQGPTAASFTAPDIVTGTPITVIKTVANDTDSTGALLPGTVVITTRPAHGAINVDPTTGDLSYTPAASYIGPDSYQYTIADSNGTVSSPGTVTINVVPTPKTVTIGHGGESSLVYTEPDGTTARFSLTNGTATVTFRNYQVTTVKKNGVLVATGAGATITDITIVPFGIRPGSITLSANGGTDGIATIGGISDPTAGLNFITGKNIQLTGALNVGALRKLSLTSTDHATITISSPALPTTVIIPTVTDTSLTTASEIVSLQSKDWLNTDAGTYKITAPIMARLLVTGTFAEDLVLTSTGLSLQTAKVRSLTGGSWDISGEVVSITAGATASAWSLNSNGLVKNLRFNGDFSSGIQVGAIGTMTIHGNMTNNVVQTNAAVSKKFAQFDQFIRLTVTGSISNATVFTAGNMGTITAASMTNTNVYAGVLLTVAQGNSFPAAASDLQADAYILGVKLTGKGTTFSNSKISAYKIDALRLGSIVTSNSGTPFGIAGRKVLSVQGTLDNSTKLALSQTQLKTQAAFTAYATAKKLTLTDFGIHIF